jgi:hypothetical protein
MIGVIRAKNLNVYPLHQYASLNQVRKVRMVRVAYRAATGLGIHVSAAPQAFRVALAIGQ